MPHPSPGLSRISRDITRLRTLPRLKTTCTFAMDYAAFLPGQWMLGLGLLFVLSTVIALMVNKRQRDAVLERLRFQRRRASGASTPPRSFSPDKKSADGPADTSCSDFADVFCPSRRCVLRDLAESASPLNQNIDIDTEPSKDFLRDHALPTTRSYDLENDLPKYTPTGFSTEEIKAMGDFPAYEILSGVPLPEPYTNFDPAKAIARPYRPFRWAYHQTMCRFHAVELSSQHH